MGQNRAMSRLRAPFRPLARLLAALPPAALLVAALTLGSAQAQESLSSALEHFVRTHTQGLPGKVSYRITPLDPRTQTAACSAFEPFLPNGARLWGKSTVGVRCLGPSSWTIYVPVHVSVAGSYYVTARPLTAGHLLGADDIAARTGDLTALPGSIVTDPAQAIGKTVRNGVGGGQALRTDTLQAPWAVQQGQSVKLVSSGAGFTATSEGKALNNAAAGQVAQVRTASGQTISGIARSGGIVEVNY